MRTPHLAFTLALALSLAPGIAAAQQQAAQEQAAQEQAAQQQEAQQQGQPADRAAFNQAFDDYKAFVRQFEDLQIQFQSADPAARRQLNADAAALVNDAKSKVDKMVQEALKIYIAEPEQDPQIASLLASAAAHKIVGSGPKGQDGDQYEAALAILTPLIENGNQSPAIASLGVIAAVCCNEHDLAARYAEIARERMEDPSGFDRQLADMATRYLDPARLAELRAMWDREKALRDAEAAADDLPRVKFQTTAGDIVLELFEDQAPIATANMITLVKSGFYNDVPFHRVLPHFMAQGGDPQGTGTGGPGYSIPCECYEPDARMHFRGSLSMAHAGRDTGGSQFFLTFVPTTHLNGIHTVYGRVVEGIEVLSGLTRVEPGDPGVTPDKIVAATVVRDRGHDYASFKKLPPR